MRKPKTSTIVRSVARRVLNPLHLGRAVKLQFQRKTKGRHRDDAQLKLYADLLPGDFLHYGYFDDPARQPEDMSLNELVAAQNRYAELLLEQVADWSSPILDVGCGMGGLTRMLQQRGATPVALTPNWMQAAYVRERFPGVEVQECKLENTFLDSQRNRFGTLITSESLQYLKLDRALPAIETLLKPGGRWIACDYFRIDEDGMPAATSDSSDPEHGIGRKNAMKDRIKPSNSGHHWVPFCTLLADRGWTLTHQRDITANVLPTLRCVHMWARRLGVTGLDFALARLRRKQPGLHYLFQDGISLAQTLVSDNLDVVDPDIFVRQKKYMLLAIERSRG